MISNSDKIMIKLAWDNMINKGEFPEYGSPETKCDKCMFYGICCFPPLSAAGCFNGWKKEEDNDYEDMKKEFLRYYEDIKKRILNI